MFQSNTGPYKMTGIETVRYRSITGPYNGPVQAQNDRTIKGPERYRPEMTGTVKGPEREGPKTNTADG